jgi:hypothetical protein
MTKKIATAVLSFLWTASGLGHITPNVELVKKGEFLRQSLPGAVRFFEKRMAWSGEDGAAVERATGWRPSDESSRVYVGRDAEKRLIGSAVFLWMPSQHGPVGIGVAFDPKGTIRRATVTDLAAEPLVWVRPLLEGQALRGLEELPAGASPEPSRLAPPGAGAMTRYYAKVIAGAVARAQSIERVSRESGKP